jgi:acetolactate synthase-1/2/3 large subunit
MTGGDIICSTLGQLGVTTVFGLPGTQNVPLFESLRRSKLRTVVSTHELAAGFMAAGYYRASGRPAVVTTIPGPGFTYILTALAEARHDSAAVLYLVVVPAKLPGNRFRLQQLDQADIVRPLVKEVFSIDEPAPAASILARAWQCALSGEPGPVYVEISDDVISQPASGSTQITGLPSLQSSMPDDQAIESAMGAISSARRPLLMLGQGAAGVAVKVRELVGLMSCPVVSTCSGRGIVAESDSRLVCGDFSGWAVKAVNELVEQSDLVLVLGCKFTHNGSSGFRLSLPAEKLIHVDASSEVLGANYPASHEICWDVAEFVDRLFAAIRESSQFASDWSPAEIEDLRTRMAELRRASFSNPPELIGTDDRDIQSFFHALQRVIPQDAIVVTDSGLHQQLVRRFYRVETTRGLIVPSDYQSMGFGLPAAIGAAIAAPERKVFVVVGDGGMLMSAMELLTAARENLDLTVIVFNDGGYGQIRRQQIADYGRGHGVDIPSPDFALLAQSLNIAYLRLSGDVEAMLRTCLRTKGVKLLEVALNLGAGGHSGRIGTILREEVKRRVGQRGIAWLKSLLGRT